MESEFEAPTLGKIFVTMAFPLKKENDSPVPPPSTVDDLVRRIIEKTHAACETTTASDAPPTSEQVIADTEFNGARYLLVRVAKPEHRPGVSLSPREHEIVRMVAQGHPNKIIADVLNISSWTVGTHLRRIFAKLGVGSRAAMIARVHELESHLPRS